MESDPFDYWYGSTIDYDADNNFKPGEWNFYTVNYDVGSAGSIRLMELEREHVDEWLDRQVEVVLDMAYERHI
jgi:hypothetical protein